MLYFLHSFGRLWLNQKALGLIWVRKESRGGRGEIREENNSGAVLKPPVFLLTERRL